MGNSLEELTAKFSEFFSRYMQTNGDQQDRYKEVLQRLELQVQSEVQKLTDSWSADERTNWQNLLDCFRGDRSQQDVKLNAGTDDNLNIYLTYLAQDVSRFEGERRALIEAYQLSENAENSPNEHQSKEPLQTSPSAPAP
jgi:hypothetical protein